MLTMRMSQSWPSSSPTYRSLCLRRARPPLRPPHDLRTRLGFRGGNKRAAYGFGRLGTTNDTRGRSTPSSRASPRRRIQQPCPVTSDDASVRGGYIILEIPLFWMVTIIAIQDSQATVRRCRVCTRASWPGKSPYSAYIVWRPPVTFRRPLVKGDWRGWYLHG